MGSLMIKEANETWLVDVPTKKIVNADVIRDGDYVFIKYSKGKFREHEFSVCRIYKTEQWAFPLSLKAWPWQKGFMNTMVRLGLMTKDRQAELIEIDHKRQDADQRKRDLEELTRLMGRYGYNEIEKAIHKLEGAA